MFDCMTYRSLYTLAALVLAAAPLAAQPDPPGPKPRPEECFESARFDVRLRVTSPVNAVSLTTTVSAAGAKLIIDRSPGCGGGPSKTKPVDSFDWRLAGPPGSITTFRPNGLSGSFVPDRAGDYTVTFRACLKGCRVTLRQGNTPAGKPILETETIGPVTESITIPVVARAQMPPLYTPPPLPIPFQPGTDTPLASTQPQRYAEPRDHCGSGVLIGVTLNPQWITTQAFTEPTPPFELAEGRIYAARVARRDFPGNHHSQDTNAMLELDPIYHRLLVDDTPTDKGTLLPLGGLEVEWEIDEYPEDFRPVPGDRMSVLGYHIIDCGHEQQTEIHPPIAVAVHRPRAVQLPASASFAPGLPAQSLGSNLFVPGIVTDIWSNLDGGQALDCDSVALHEPRLIPIPGTVPPKFNRPCVKQPAAGARFEFHIFLPKSPQQRIRELDQTPASEPSLFVQIQNHPRAVALGARSDLPVNILERRLTGPTPYLRVAVDLTSLRTRQRFAKRIVAAWVYPDLQNRNFGLRALRVRLNELEVTDDGDPFLKGDGDWKLWAVFPSIRRPWTQLINCNGCVEEKTYNPSSSIWLRGAMSPEGDLTGDALLFQGQTGTFILTGYESDLMTSDDAGNVMEPLNIPGKRSVISQCNDQTVGGLASLDPSTSSCAGYTIRYEVLSLPLPVPTLSAQARQFFERLMVGEQMPLLGIDPSAVELFKFDTMSEERAKLTVRRKDDPERWQTALAPDKMAAEMKEPAAEPFLKDLRKHVEKELGQSPTPKHRCKITLELRALKPSVPPDLYEKLFAEFESTEPCPAR